MVSVKPNLMVKVGLEAAALGTVLKAVEFLEGLWSRISPKDPINVVIADGSKRPTVQSPKLRTRKDREVKIVIPVNYYKPPMDIVVPVKLIRLDPVAAALRGELYMTENDQDKLATAGECVVFLASYCAWNVLRHYKLVDGRKGKTASARYAFENLRAFREMSA